VSDVTHVVFHQQTRVFRINFAIKKIQADAAKEADNSDGSKSDTTTIVNLLPEVEADAGATAETGATSATIVATVTTLAAAANVTSAEATVTSGPTFLLSVFSTCHLSYFTFPNFLPKNAKYGQVLLQLLYS
jgi:hypothetical protein